MTLVTLEERPAVSTCRFFASSEVILYYAPATMIRIRYNMPPTYRAYAKHIRG